MIVLFILNFIISYFNAWACGKGWPESKHRGGWAHFMNWMGAIMSACGFTWCLLVVIGTVGSAIPYDSSDPKHVTGLISPLMLKAICDLGYIAIIGPIIGSGLALTIDAWAHFYRNRSFGNGAVAVYDTAAQAYNMYQAVEHVPSILSELGDIFGGSSSSIADADDEGYGLSGLAILIVILVVLCAILGGIFLTRAIILSTASSSASDRRFQFSQG